MMRLDLDLLQQWVEPGSRVLDLGCGEGELLSRLQAEKSVNGLGLEIDPYKITSCLKKGLNVVEHNLDGGLGNFQDKSFDVVILSQTLQAVRFPHLVLDEMLRVGKHCIVSFPNFGHWRCRLHLGVKGTMPVSKFMPFSWYDTPNIHFCTIRDFEALCWQKNIHIVNKAVVNQDNQTPWTAKTWPNLFAITGLYHITS